ncbi:MAG TPA: response regulator transcription factor, partial [Chloroflexota bacterium]
MSEPIRVLLVDDHAVVRSGLAAFLSAYDDLDLVGEAPGGGQALAMCERARPDVILMDLMMPGVDGVSATRTIRERYPEVQVIALTSFPEDDMVQQALHAGAIGYLLKNVSAAQLADAIRSAKAGQPTLAPEAAKALIHASTHPKADDSELTAREL